MKPVLFFWLNPFVLGWLFVFLGVPLALQRIPPNGFYGFRTPKTLGDPSVWYRANGYTGKMFIFSGLVSVIGAVFFRGFLQHSRLTPRGQVIALMSCIEFLPVLAAVVASAVYVGRIKMDR